MAGKPRTFVQDPADLLNYTFDFSSILDDGDTIQTYAIEVDTGITLVTDFEDNGLVTVYLSGGAEGERYRIHCTATTSAGLRYRSSFFIALDVR